MSILSNLSQRAVICWEVTRYCLLHLVDPIESLSRKKQLLVLPGKRIHIDGRVFFLISPCDDDFEHRHLYSQLQCLLLLDEVIDVLN
jgi:hypothetical protein